MIFKKLLLTTLAALCLAQPAHAMDWNTAWEFVQKNYEKTKQLVQQNPKTSALVATTLLGLTIATNIYINYKRHLKFNREYDQKLATDVMNAQEKQSYVQKIAAILNSQNWESPEGHATLMGFCEEIGKNFDIFKSVINSMIDLQNELNEQLNMILMAKNNYSDKKLTENNIKRIEGLVVAGANPFVRYGSLNKSPDIFCKNLKTKQQLDAQQLEQIGAIFAKSKHSPDKNK